MNDKYIIKNCPSYIGEFEREYSCGNETNELFCKDCTDCVMKQIVELCRNKMDTEFNSGSMFAEEILDLLQIEVPDET